MHGFSTKYHDIIDSPLTSTIANIDIWVGVIPINVIANVCCTGQAYMYVPYEKSPSLL